MKPSPCRMVMVFVDPAHNNGEDTAPAVITRAWSDDLVNVRVFYDGPAVPSPYRQDWLTSLPLFETRAAAELDHSRRYQGHDHVPPRPAAAFWPPRIPGDTPPRH